MLLNNWSRANPVGSVAFRRGLKYVVVSERAKQNAFRGPEYWRRERAERGSVRRDVRKSLERVERITGKLMTEDFHDMMSQLSKKGLVEEILEVSKYAEERGIPIDNTSLKSLFLSMFQRKLYDPILQMFTACTSKGMTFGSEFPYHIILFSMARLRKKEEAELLFQEQQKKQPVKAILYDAMMYVYAHSGDLQACKRVWDDRIAAKFKPTVTSFNILMRAYNRAGDVEGITEVFEQLQKEIQPDETSFTTLLHTLFLGDRLADAMKLVQRIDELGFRDSKHIVATIVHGLVQAGKLKEASAFLKQNKWPSVHAYTSLINGHIDSGDLITSLTLLEEMKAAGIAPSATTYGFLIQAFAKEKKNKKICFELLGEMLESNLVPTARIHTTMMSLAPNYKAALRVFEEWNTSSSVRKYRELLEFCALKGDVGSLFKTLEQMEKSGEMEYLENHQNAVMDRIVLAYAKAQSSEGVLKTLTGMKERGLEPTERTYEQVLVSLVRSKENENATELFNYLMGEESIKVTRRMCFTALTAFWKQSRFSEAEELVQDMNERYGHSSEVYNELILGYAHKGEHWRTLWMVYEEMKILGLKRDSNTRRALMIGSMKRVDKVSARRPEEFFDELVAEGKAVSSDFNRMLLYLMRRKKHNRADKLLYIMKEEKIAADEKTDQLVNSLRLWRRKPEFRDREYRHRVRRRVDGRLRAIFNELKEKSLSSHIQRELVS